MSKGWQRQRGGGGNLTRTRTQTETNARRTPSLKISPPLYYVILLWSASLYFLFWPLDQTGTGHQKSLAEKAKPILERAYARIKMGTRSKTGSASFRMGIFLIRVLTYRILGGMGGSGLKKGGNAPWATESQRCKSSASHESFQHCLLTSYYPCHTSAAAAGYFNFFSHPTEQVPQLNSTESPPQPATS
jgi:hypothetical protein